MPIGAPLVPVRCRACGRYLLDVERGAAYSIRCRRCGVPNIGCAGGSASSSADSSRSH